MKSLLSLPSFSPVRVIRGCRALLFPITLTDEMDGEDVHRSTDQMKMNQVRPRSWTPMRAEFFLGENALCMLCSCV